MKRSMIAVVGVAAVMLAGVAGAAQAGYTEGFEGAGPFNFYAGPGCSSGVTTAQAHSGTHSAEFVLNATNQAYTRFKSVDISLYGFKVKDVQASDWVLRTLGRSDLSPYLLFTINTPNMDPNDETIAVQFSMAVIANDVWTENAIDRPTTTFHVVGADRGNLGTSEFSSSGTQGTLDDLSDIWYDSAHTIKWGDLPISYVRVGVGLWDAAQEYHGFADDINITPEPATMALLAAGGIGMLLRRRRNK